MSSTWQTSWLRRWRASSDVRQGRMRRRRPSGASCEAPRMLARPFGAA